ncbi:MAG: glycolate oxidase subunit GlcE [Burkholderiaceae bacterium]
MHPLTEAQAQEWRTKTAGLIQEARGRQQALHIQGHGSKAFYGQPMDPAVPILSTQDYAGVVAYDPSELVVVARAGTALTDLEAVLAERQQRLAFEPPRFHGRGTVGGMIATGLSGPGRLSAGPCKDYVLGLTVMNGDGALMRFGGTVMKNVAGYDMSRLHTGAMGILGLILEVSLKVLPEPAARRTVQIACPRAKSIAWADQWLSEPLPVSATAWVADADGNGSLNGHDQGSLVVRFAGAAAAVDAAVERFEASYGAPCIEEHQAADFWSALRDQTQGFFSSSKEAPRRRLWRLSVPAETPDLPMPGSCLLEWGGALRWLWTDASAAEVRSLASAVGGHASLYLGSAEDRTQEGCLAPLSPVLQGLHQRIKAELDPHRLFNPGRLIGGL